MAVFKYTATTMNEEHTETGTVIAANEADARNKLKARKFNHVRVKKLAGLNGLISRFTATVK